jgi:hypothetical protein
MLFYFLLNLPVHVNCFQISLEHQLILGCAQLVVAIQSWVEQSPPIYDLAACRKYIDVRGNMIHRISSKIGE